MSLNNRLIVDSNIDFGVVHDLLVALFEQFGGYYNRSEFEGFLCSFAFSKNIGLETLIHMFLNAANNLQLMQICHDRRNLSRLGKSTAGRITDAYNLPRDLGHILHTTYSQEAEMMARYLTEFSGEV